MLLLSRIGPANNYCSYLITLILKLNFILELKHVRLTVVYNQDINKEVNVEINIA